MRKRHKGFLNSIPIIKTADGDLPSLNSRVIVENEYIPYGVKEVYTLSNQYQYRIRGRLLKLTIEKPDLYLLEFLNPGYSYGIKLALGSFRTTDKTYLAITNEVFFILTEYKEERIVFKSQFLNQGFYSSIISKIYDINADHYVYALIDMSGYSIFTLNDEIGYSETYPVNVFRAITSPKNFISATRKRRNRVDGVPILPPLDISTLSIPSSIQHITEDRWEALRNAAELDLL